jgi:hypothetical protein
LLKRVVPLNSTPTASTEIIKNEFGRKDMDLLMTWYKIHLNTKLKSNAVRLYSSYALNFSMKAHMNHSKR